MAAAAFWGRDQPEQRAPLVCWFEDCDKNSVSLVGGKCSSLGELIHAGVRVPPGFALTTEGYRAFMAPSGIEREMKLLLQNLDCQNLEALERASASIRAAIEAQPFSAQLEDLVAESYRQLSVR